MKKLLLICLLAGLAITTSQAGADPKKEVKKPAKKKRSLRKTLVPFSFINRELTDIINFLADKYEVNIILPQGINAISPDHKISYQPTGRDVIPLEDAWNLMQTFLNLSDYAMTTQGDFFVIAKNDEKITREIFPIYINVLPSQLPNSDEKIRYVYYFTNLKLNDIATFDSLRTIFEDVLSANKLVSFDAKSNSVIITDRSRMISSLMQIIHELDSTGFRETVEVIQLFNARAEEVKKIFDSLRLATDKVPFLRGDPRAELSTYFPSGTVITVNPMRNQLIVMGRESAVSRIREFVTEELDAAPESGSSILHVYDLQYLNAQEFAPVLQAIVSRQISGDQSRGEAVGSPERFFTGVIIQAETLVEITKDKPVLGIPEVEQAKGLSGSVYSGGNRLVIAAFKDDWIRIKNLIDTLDKPQPQVIIEVFIVDFSKTDNLVLAGDLRNRLNCNIDKGINFLASHISPTNTILPPAVKTLATDLMSISTTTDNPSVGAVVDPGSLLISFNNPCTGIADLLQILQAQLDVKIVTRPHMVTTNNRLANIAETVIRRDRGEVFSSGSGVPTTPIVDVKATIQVQAIPRINSENRLSLEVGIDINDFPDSVSLTRQTRRVATNANMNSGQVLVLGGLTRINNSDTETITPILGRIPIVRWFFSGDRKLDTHTNLAVFICPTIVQPKLRSGLNMYTTDKIRYTKNDASRDFIVEDNYKDPITRFFFKTKNSSEETINEYLSHSTNAPGVEEFQKERKRPESDSKKLKDMLSLEKESPLCVPRPK